ELKRAHARFEPTFIAGINYAANDYPADYSEAENLDYYGQIRVPMVTGGQLNFAVPISRTETQGTYYYNDEITGQTITYDSQNKYYNSNVRMQLSQPLLRGAGTDINTHAIRMSSYGRQSQLASSKLSTMSVLVSVDKAYWQVYYAQEALKVIEMDFDLAKAQYERTERMLELDQVSQIELLRAQNTMSQKLSGITASRYSLSQSRRALKEILNAQGLKVDSDVIVEAVSEPVALKYQLDKQQLIAYALANRMELLEYELQLASQESTLEFTKNSLLPSLSLDYIYNFRAMGASFSDTMDMLGERELNDHRVGLSLAVPLGNRAAKSDYRSALLTREVLKLDQEMKKTAIINSVVKAIEDLQAAWNNIVISDKNVDIALRTFQAEQRQFDLGMQNSTELMLARNTYSSAMLERLNALVKYQNCQIDLCYQTGGLNQAAKLQF
ncbi:MAG: TolC family protein, partial [Sedimentisphaerales bacterium]|nr:TolC family protein [Sedimentisphaerales bacterium]